MLDLITRADDHPALVVPGGDSVTYAELHEAVERLARQLAAVGVGPGDAVALSVANSPATVICFLAVVRAGAAAAPLNPVYTGDEFRSYLQDLRPKVMLLDAGAGAAIATVCRELGISVIDVSASSARGIAIDGGHPGGPLPAPDPDAIALLLHTSGTTSRPKVVPLRQRNLAASIQSIAAGYELGPGDISHCVMPLFHVHGLVASTLSTLATGGVVVIPPRFSASAFWPDTVGCNATWYSAVPTIHMVLNSRAAEDPIPPNRLRFARSCSAPLMPTLQEELEARLGIPLVQAYGMTEAAHQMASNPLPPGERRPGSVGRATGVEIAVVDDQWRPVGPDQGGEVTIRGSSVIDGYLDNPEANACSFRDRWFRTGDAGSLSPDGYLTLTGRIKEMINRGGEKISPVEVEEVVLRHPAVQEAVAYGQPDPKYGEQVGLVLVSSAPVTQEEIQAHCASSLAGFKVPASVTVVEAIPKGSTGKVQRRLLADQLKR